MGKQHGPFVADPGMETDFSFGFRFEIRGGIADV